MPRSAIAQSEQEPASLPKQGESKAPPRPWEESLGRLRESIDTMPDELKLLYAEAVKEVEERRKSDRVDG
jgi:hypothetical protein